ncbi:C4-dicarboxylate TRAP transporter substrate-binding protein [Roseovarius sp.]|uniref:C4-dicarboxylate TRAP transporter substrate-binding protein n=1 Tax=Roseovarius sp. TaxID=1486281 RepID=UPI0035678C6A
MKMTFHRQLATSFFVLASAGAAGAQETTSFNASVWLPENHPLAKHSYVEWLPRLREASDGTLDPTLYTGPVLLPPGGHLTGIADGIAHVGYHAGTYTPSELPEDNVLAQLSFSYQDPYVAAFAITEANLTIPELQDQWMRNNVVYLGGYAIPPYNLLCVKEVVTLEDIQGARIRVPGAAHSDWADAIGAAPVNVPSSEMYSGLDRGQIDCAAIPANDLQTRSLWDVAKHATLIDLGVYYSGYSQAANRDFWQGLSADQRQAFFETIPVALVDQLHHYDETIAAALDAAEEEGVTLHEPSDELLATVEEFQSQARESAIRMGEETFGMSNPETIVDQFEQVVQKWTELLDGVDRSDREALIELAVDEIYAKLDPEFYAME